MLVQACVTLAWCVRGSGSTLEYFRLHHSIRRVWYTAYCELDVAKGALPADDPDLGDAYALLRDAWANLGAVVCLNPMAEYLVAKCFCFREGCMYYLRPAAKALKVCRGCGVAQYCCKECQIA